MRHHPIIPWMGGKRRLSSWILPKFPKHKCYVEAFAGGGALFFAKDESQAHLRLSRTYIEHLSWEKVFTKYDREHTLTYLDPPYWQTSGYSIEFPWEHYELMNKMVRECKGMAIISLNAHPDILELFEGLHMETKDIKYTVSGGKGTQAKELLIWNNNVQNNLKPVDNF